jgi:hypothetical protein
MIAAAATWRIDATAARRAAVAYGRALNRRLAAAASDDPTLARCARPTPAGARLLADLAGWSPSFLVGVAS